MRATLRLVTGGICAFSVLVVAVATLSITSTMSLATLRDIGQQHASALASTARVQAEAFFAVPAESLESIGDMFKLDDWYPLSADPDNPSLSIHLKYMHMLSSLIYNANFSYSALGVIFDDGSGTNVFVRQLFNKTVLHFESRSGWRFPERNMTGFRRGLEISTGIEVTQAEMNAQYIAWITNTDARFPTYTIAKNFIGGGSGFWTGMIMDMRSGVFIPEFVLPAVQPLFNHTGGFVGFALLGQPTASLDRFLKTVKGTANTQSFVVDSSARIVASTHPEPFLDMTVITSLDAPVPNGCSSTGDTDIGYNPVNYIGCRALAADFPYAALNAAADVDGGAFLSSAVPIVTMVDTPDDGQHFVASTPIRNKFRFFNFNIITIVPESDILSNVVAGRYIAFGVTAAVFIIASAVSTAIVYALLQPLSDVSRRMRDTAKLREAESLPELSNLAEIQDLQRAYTNMNTAIQSFTRYVPRDVVKDLMSTGQLCAIRMVPQQCTMLFVDIAGFTTVCERVPPALLSTLVSHYFDRASRIVMEHDGLIDKYIGDCIMAVWGAPFAVSNQEVKATLAGLRLHRETLVDPLAEEWDDAGEVLRVRVGISTGEVLAGNMGSADRMNYTVIGDPVNLAARLESLNKQFDTRVMVSEMTAERLAGIFVLRLLMPIAVVGKEKPVRVFEVMGLRREFEPAAILRVQDSDRTIGIDDGSNNDHWSDLGSQLSVVAASAAAQQDTAELGTRSRKSKLFTLTMLREAALHTATTVPLTCTAEEERLCASVTAAVNTYIQGDFAHAIDALQTAEEEAQRIAANDNASAASAKKNRVSSSPQRSIDIVRGLCEAYLKNGRPDGFDGVYRALEK